MIDPDALARDAAALVAVPSETGDERAALERLGERGEPLEDAALVAGDARNLHERGRVGGQHPCVDHGVASSVASSASSAAMECIRRTALVSARV